ncbi:PorP/SprF family type IX secretion system membrane protein [Ferruginibacter albus]|uniref:PorP/SprF family type IX secretion system membrane protein n=1 Tax=Ferruginibacter albus TaxID=2875540 RepID=UPI001CC55C01|nr:PorP/SprF family type IX secretion system membrane protein [Ferruginibacter albus]UAY52291.1 PorP/SprF family type IX secretion system membrane protein [Ferruginibacter albus]
MRRKGLLYFILFIGIFNKTTAQVDPHFSQFYAYPLYLNPALTGVLDGDYRATAIHRNQWNVFGAPFVTTGISADMTTKSKLNVGINIFDQTAGDGGYNYLQGALSLAYSGLQLDAKGFKKIIIGLQVGFINRRFDPAKLKFGDQWVFGTGYDPNIVSHDLLSTTSATTFDAAAGIAYYDNDPDKSVNPFIGFSMDHLTQPVDPFLSTGLKEKLPYRYTIHGGLKYFYTERVSITPNFIYMQQGNANEIMIGANVQVPANPASQTDIIGGINYRLNDAISPFAGLYFNHVTIGVSYDINTSSLGKAVKNTNSYELSLTVTGKRVATDNSFRCAPPRF